MSAHLEAILDDLRVGLRRRSERRRARARAAAGGSAALVLVLAALATGTSLDRGGSALASSSAATDAAQLLQGCHGRAQFACDDPLSRQ
jgi:hypothetical protein